MTQQHVLLCADCAQHLNEQTEQPLVGVLVGNCKRCGRKVGHLVGTAYRLVPFKLAARHVTLTNLDRHKD